MAVKSKHRGAVGELKGILWLLDQGYEVFRNVSGAGPIDIVAIKDGETLRLDVKARSSLKPLLVEVTDEQRNLDVKLLVITPTEIAICDLPAPPGIIFCENCGASVLKRNNHSRRWCSNRCKNQFTYKQLKIVT